MRVRPAPASALSPKLRVACTDHPITVWAGVLLLRLYVDLLDRRTALTRVLTPVAKTSHPQIPVGDVLLAWWYGLALGAERVDHLTRYRRDLLLPRLLGLPRVPSPETGRRFFGRFTDRHTTDVSEALMRLSLGSRRPTLLGHTLDLDSTVFWRYGEHEGSLLGHHPIKHGRPSHHPLVAWLSERRRLLGATWRAGQAGTANGVRECLAHALTMLLAGHRIGLGRADAGFGVPAVFTALEARDLPSIIVARLTPLVRKLIIHRIPEGEWQPVTRGIAVAEVMATLPAWRGQARRVVCLRQTLTERPAAHWRRLIECPGYTPIGCSSPPCPLPPNWSPGCRPAGPTVRTASRNSRRT
jgi:hypothetical protein